MKNLLASESRTNNDNNRVRHQDRVVHEWYRFVLSFPPHLVQNYLSRFNIDQSQIVLDPFCGTGTTLVECKKGGIESVGLESNPMAFFASSVKTCWNVDTTSLTDYIKEVTDWTSAGFKQEGIEDGNEIVNGDANLKCPSNLRHLELEPEKLLLKNSISPLPLHKTLVLLDAIDTFGDIHLQRFGRLALANVLVNHISNLRFGPEVGVGRIKKDAPVISVWRTAMCKIVDDLDLVSHQAGTLSRVELSDSRQASLNLTPKTIDAVITSPPYPNEKDYSRTTRLESVVLGFVRNRQELRSLKKSLIRSNTRGVYKSDTDDQLVAEHAEVQRIANTIEKRRVKMGKTSGFERLYPRVTQLYFGGMAKHLSTLRPALKPNARLAYVVGDQASYLRVKIRTGEILSDIARSLGYRTVGIDLFRTRPSTVTGEQLREEVVVLEWPGSQIERNG